MCGFLAALLQLCLPPDFALFAAYAGFCIPFHVGIVFYHTAMPVFPSVFHVGSYPLLTHLVIVRIQFKAYEVSVGVQAGYGGGTATHAVVEHGFILVAVGAYQVFKQRKGFL